MQIKIIMLNGNLIAIKKQLNIYFYIKIINFWLHYLADCIFY